MIIEITDGRKDSAEVGHAQQTRPQRAPGSSYARLGVACTETWGFVGYLSLKLFPKI